MWAHKQLCAPWSASCFVLSAVVSFKIKMSRKLIFSRLLQLDEEQDEEDMMLADASATLT